MPATAAGGAKAEYLKEVTARGLAVEDGTDEAAVVDEQAAHVEALVLAWCRVRLPKWLDEYEVIEVEVEDRVPLAEDVVLASRPDAIVRRKADHRLFVVNFKTVAQADERWLRSWEVDMQMMTELLAAERRHGHEFGGVIIEGLMKGVDGAVRRSEMAKRSAYGDRRRCSMVTSAMQIHHSLPLHYHSLKVPDAQGLVQVQLTLARRTL